MRSPPAVTSSYALLTLTCRIADFPHRVIGVLPGVSPCALFGDDRCHDSVVAVGRTDRAVFATQVVGVGNRSQFETNPTQTKKTLLTNRLSLESLTGLFRCHMGINRHRRGVRRVTAGMR